MRYQPQRASGHEQVHFIPDEGFGELHQRKSPRVHTAARRGCWMQREVHGVWERCEPS
jgi:hypothetical protein